MHIVGKFWDVIFNGHLTPQTPGKSLPTASQSVIFIVEASLAIADTSIIHSDWQLAVMNMPGHVVLRFWILDQP